MLDLAGKFKILSLKDIEEIHQASMEILTDIGIKLENQQVLKYLKDKKVDVNPENSIVRLTNTVVEEALATAPSEIVLYGREDENNLILNNENVYLGSGGTAVNVIDLYDGQRRKTVSKDVVDTARLVDKLQYIDFYVIPVYPGDYAKEKADEIRFINALEHTSKHVMGGVYTGEGIKKVIEHAAELAGSRQKLQKEPFISMITSIISPLQMEKNYAGFLKYIVEQGIPVVAPPAPIAGATSPLTLAGTLAQLNAETLFGIVLTQLIKPGARVLYGIVPTTMDLKTSSFRFGSIETGIMNAAGAQLGRYYNLPVYNTAGVTDARIPDIEAGYEKMANILLSALAGSDFIHDAAGLIDSGLTVAYEQYVIDNEILGMVKRVLKGVEVNRERLAVQEIRDVGAGGNFLTAPGTLKYMRSELFDQKLMEPARWEEWNKKGARDVRERAANIAREILNKKEGD